MAFDLSDEFHSIRKLDDIDVKVLEQRVVAFTSPNGFAPGPGPAARRGMATRGQDCQDFHGVGPEAAEGLTL